MEEDIGIGSRLRAARGRVGWSREALAFHSGVSWSAIAQVESGRRRNLRPSTLSALAGALGITIDYLVSGGAGRPMLEHRALLYGADAEFLAGVAPFLAGAIDRSEAVLAVIGAAHVEPLKEQLGAGADAVRFVEQSEWYRTPVAALSGYQSFVKASLEAGAPWVRIVGEPVWTDRSASEARVWCRYEALLNLAFAGSPATVLCPYDTRAVDDDVLSHAGATHPHTFEGDLLSASGAYADPGSLVLEP